MRRNSLDKYRSWTENKCGAVAHHCMCVINSLICLSSVHLCICNKMKMREEYLTDYPNDCRAHTHECCCRRSHNVCLNTEKHNCICGLRDDQCISDKHACVCFLRFKDRHRNCLSETHLCLKINCLPRHHNIVKDHIIVCFCKDIAGVKSATKR